MPLESWQTAKFQNLQEKWLQVKLNSQNALVYMPPLVYSLSRYMNLEKSGTNGLSPILLLNVYKNWTKTELKRWCKNTEH